MISCLAPVLLAFVPGAQGGDPVVEELLFLARHQGVDGLWGTRPPGCVCLARPVWPEGGGEPDPATKARVEAMIGRFSEAEIGERTAAERELVRIGRPAVSQLRHATSMSDVETAARCRGILDRLGRALEAPDAGLTGLAVLGFLGAGYSHLSKDTYEGICFGTVVRRGLEALKAHQREDGTWDAGEPVSNAWAALAMSEAYGLTGSNFYKGSAEKGLESVERVVPKDARQAVWKALAARSGILGEAWKAGTPPVRVLHGQLAAQEGTFAEVGALILEACLDRRRGGPRADALAALDPWSLDGETLLLCSIGMRSGWKASEEPCKAWMEKLKVRVIHWGGTSRCGHSVFTEGVRSSGFRVLTIEAYYRYGNSLATSGFSQFER